MKYEFKFTGKEIVATLQDDVSDSDYEGFLKEYCEHFNISTESASKQDVLDYYWFDSSTVEDDQYYLTDSMITSVHRVHRETPSVDNADFQSYIYSLLGINSYQASKSFDWESMYEFIMDHYFKNGGLTISLYDFIKDNLIVYRGDSEFMQWYQSQTNHLELFYLLRRNQTLEQTISIICQNTKTYYIGCCSDEQVYIQFR